MALPKNTQATVGLNEESKEALRNVSDNVKNAGRNFVTNVKKQARERTSDAVKATGRGTTRAASGAVFAATQNPFVASGVQKSLESIGKIPDIFKKFTGLFGGQDNSPQQKTNENLEQVKKNQNNQKGVFTDILNVLKDIREDFDTMMGINREELQLKKEQDRERESQRLLSLEKQREKARQQPRDEFGRFIKKSDSQIAQDSTDQATTFFAGGFFGSILQSLKGALLGMFTISFWKRGLKALIKAGSKFGPLAIITFIFAGIKGGVEGFMNSEKNTLIGKVFDGVDNAVGEILEWLSFGLIDSDKTAKMMERLRNTISDFVSGMVDKLKGLFNERNISGDALGDVVTNKETGKKMIIKDIENTGPGPSTIILKNPRTGETREIGEDELGREFKREEPVKQGSSSVGTNQNNVDKAISDASKEFDVPESVLRKMAFFESGMDPTAKNPNTSAKGLFQITDNTEDLIRKNLGVSGNAMNASDASRMAAALTKDEIKAFERKYGAPPTAEQLQAIHLLGRDTAFKAFDNPNKDIGQIDPAAVRNNKWLQGEDIDEALVSIGKRFKGTPQKSKSTVDVKPEPNPRIRQNMSNKLEEDVKNQSSQKQSQNNVIAPSVQQDNRQYSETTNMGPPAKSGSSESTLAALNQINGLA